MRVSSIGKSFQGTPEDRLQFVIDNYADAGYLIVYRDSRSAQLRRAKVFSFLFAFLWLLLFGFGLIVYLLYYFAKSDDVIYISLNENGDVVISD